MLPAQPILSLLAMLVPAPMLVPQLLALGPPEIGVHGDLACPAPERVAARLRPLLSDDVGLPAATWIDLRAADAGGAREPRDRQLSPVPPVVHIVVVDAAGSPDIPIGKVRTDASCDDAADEAAVLIAAWLGRYETPASVDVDIDTARASRQDRPQENRPQDQMQDREDPSASRPASRFRGTLGLAAGLVQGLAGPATPTGAVEGVLLRSAGPRTQLVARLSLSLSGTRNLPLGPGSSQWQRLAGVLAVGWRRRLGRAPVAPATVADVGTPDGPGGAFFVELTGGPIVADSRIAGTGYANDFRSSGIDAGVAPALRIG